MEPLSDYEIRLILEQMEIADRRGVGAMSEYVVLGRQTVRRLLMELLGLRRLMDMELEVKKGGEKGE